MANEIRIEISGLSDLTAALDRIKAALDQATREATIKAGQTLQVEAVKNFQGAHAIGFPHVGGAPPNTVTGNLQRSIKSLPVVSQGHGKYSIKVGPTAIYSRIIELGGRITPKNAKALSWIAMPGAKRVFAQSVTIKPHPYFIPAAESMAAKARSIFSAAWQRAISDG